MVKVHVQRSTTKEFARRHRGTFFSSCVAMCNDHSPLRRRLRHNRHASRRGPPRDIRFLSVGRWRRRGMAEAGTGVPKVAIHRICVVTSPQLVNCPHTSQTYSMKEPIPCTDSRSGISRFVPRWIRPKGHCRIYFRLPIASASDSAYISPEAMAICLSSSLTAPPSDARVKMHLAQIDHTMIL